MTDRRSPKSAPLHFAGRAYGVAFIQESATVYDYEAIFITMLGNPCPILGQAIRPASCWQKNPVLGITEGGKWSLSPTKWPY